ncbi:MAG: YitT family protein [Anaerolineales bacterium]|nr:YitT family protein [Anaerolineales bacterium]MCZ2120984.1 hypothetical protein [Anaerolineales bacterium]
MLKPIRWNTFVRDLFVIQIGFALFGLSIALTLQSNLGTSTWTVFEAALAKLTGLSIGATTILNAFFILIFVLILKEQVGWGTLANILSIGLWLNLFLAYIPSIRGQIILQSLMLLAGVFMQGFASAIYIGVSAGAGPRDSLMLAIHRTTKLSLRVARASIEIVVFIAGWALGGPAGIGTLVFALLIGPAVQWAFKLLKVQPHQPALEKMQVALPLPEGD